jgi:plastocyanin
VIVAVPPPARVQVVAREFTLAPSRRTLKAGTAIVELANFGEDPHDLRLQRVGGTKVYGVPVQQSGHVGAVTVRLVPGTYRLWCSLADHRARGMRATLVVVRRTG